MTPKEVLIAARQLIAQPKGWTQGTLARDKDGLQLSYESPEAYSFCLIGAIDRASGFSSKTKDTETLTTLEARNAALDSLANVLNTHDMALWNDRPHRTQADVICVFSVAIEVAALTEESLAAPVV